MKKITTIFLLVFAFTQTVVSMIPGPPIAINCPKCGEEKKLMSIISGNTFAAVQWSDAYQYSPMLPRLSPVQKCPECGNYFMLRDEDLHYTTDEKGFVSDTGRLSFNEMKEALQKLEIDTLSKEEEISLRLEFVHIYNDAFRDYLMESEENDGKITRSDEDRKLHISNLNSLISLLDKNDPVQLLLIAEFYREAGDFTNSLLMIDSYKPQSEYLDAVFGQIIQKSKAKDDTVFRIDVE